jgi:hypothetical protein
MRSPKGFKRNGVFPRLQKHGRVSGNVSSFGGEMIDALERERDHSFSNDEF